VDDTPWRSDGQIVEFSIPLSIHKASLLCGRVYFFGDGSEEGILLGGNDKYVVDMVQTSHHTQFILSLLLRL
jgi:hypothetical protein